MIDKLVHNLPEVYQPIFGHPELSTSVSRPCADRLIQIEQIYTAIENLVGRPLHVLDLGCAQGFFSLNLAQRGAIVHGVDFSDKNIALCRALAQEHPNLQISFEEDRIEDVVHTLQPSRYDLVLGLSVFHHLIHAHGVANVKNLLEKLAQSSGALVLEVALQNEPLYWGPSQPADPRELINNIGFVHLMTHCGTHLSAITRPLFIASNYYWVLDGVACKINKWSFEPHMLANGAHQLSRRYFFSDNIITKHYRIDGIGGLHNKAEYAATVDFLCKPPDGFNASKLFSFGENSSEAWLVMQKLPGRLLLEIIQDGATFNSRKILLSVLHQLAILESIGLYHNDVRAWNLLIDESNENFYLIDYGSITTKPNDCAWPGNLFLSFLIFIKEVVTRQVDNPTPIRSTSISPYGLPEPYRAWVINFWNKPTKEWSFEYLHKTLENWPEENINTDILDQPLSIWMQAIEESIQIEKQNLNQLNLNITSKDQLKQALAISQGLLIQLQQTKDQHQQSLIQNNAEASAQLSQVQAELDQAYRSNHHHWHQAQELQARINSLHKSWSWTLTAPLRWASYLLFRTHALKSVANKILGWIRNIA